MLSSIRFLVLAAFVTAITAVGALTSFTIPALSVVPFTLQVFGVYLAGGLLPPRWALMSLLAYLFLGALGLPIFADGQSGLGVLIGPYAGYLWAYPLAAMVMALVTGRSASRLRLLVGLLVNIVIIYAGGVLGLRVATGASWMKAFLEGVLPFVFWDLLKAFIAFPVIMRVRQLTIRRWTEKTRASG